MSYASVDDWLLYEAAHKTIADTDYDGEADRDVIETALSRASAEMDGWLASRTDTPVTDPKSAPVLKHHCTLIATYHLANTANTVTEEIETRYKASLSWLKSVSEGKSSLPMSPNLSSSGGNASGIGATFVLPERIFK
ncbi:Mu-like prophage protein gp36 [Cohaesibacter sp. ES.047]|uniref:DUF1320 domain-containing protein n=1 Tax=Cohaesibacter sp. ES.047 TaxID=1798205 RepID=UPI000BB96B42|nr:DUF1320 domain-containing protein [Cohaesibacter sp. ES.047]SNY91391.1 Mu-like prophage protein gp36 [Cohaesibacter sp. ES.047]